MINFYKLKISNNVFNSIWFSSVSWNIINILIKLTIYKKHRNYAHTKFKYNSLHIIWIFHFQKKMAKMSPLTFLFLFLSFIMIHHLPVVSSTNYCVAGVDSTKLQLQLNINFGCSQGVDCRAIQPGGSCFNPNKLINHASYVMNAYYQTHGRTQEACKFVFGIIGIITTTYPYGDCSFWS